LSQGNVYVYRATQTKIGTINLPRYTVIYSIEVFSQRPPESKIISAAGWATYCSPYALDFSQPIANLTQAYYVTGLKADGTTLTMLPIDGIVPPQTGILLKGQGTCQIPILSGSNADTHGNLLVGVLEDQVLEAETIYVLMKESSGLGFYRNKYNFTVGANSAYLPADYIDNLRATPTESRAYKFVEDADLTGIATTTTQPLNDGRYYNLSGQLVTKPLRKGLYIVNGKKVIIK
jgi:hypothetical protein